MRCIHCRGSSAERQLDANAPAFRPSSTAAAHRSNAGQPPAAKGKASMSEHKEQEEHSTASDRSTAAGRQDQATRPHPGAPPLLSESREGQTRDTNTHHKPVPMPVPVTDSLSTQYGYKQLAPASAIKTSGDSMQQHVPAAKPPSRGPLPSEEGNMHAPYSHHAPYHVSSSGMGPSSYMPRTGSTGDMHSEIAVAAGPGSGGHARDPHGMHDTDPEEDRSVSRGAADMVEFINQHKLAGRKPMYMSGGMGVPRSTSRAGDREAKWVQPSGECTHVFSGLDL